MTFFTSLLTPQEIVFVHESDIGTGVISKILQACADNGIFFWYIGEVSTTHILLPLWNIPRQQPMWARTAQHLQAHLLSVVPTENGQQELSQLALHARWRAGRWNKLLNKKISILCMNLPYRQCIHKLCFLIIRLLVSVQNFLLVFIFRFYIRFVTFGLFSSGQRCIYPHLHPVHPLMTAWSFTFPQPLKAQTLIPGPWTGNTAYISVKGHIRI